MACKVGKPASAFKERAVWRGTGTQHMVSLLGCKLFEGRRGIYRNVSYFAPYFTKVTFIVENLEKMEEPKKKHQKTMKIKNTNIWDIFFSVFSVHIIIVSFS